MFCLKPNDQQTAQELCGLVAIEYIRNTKEPVSCAELVSEIGNDVYLNALNGGFIVGWGEKVFPIDYENLPEKYAVYLEKHVDRH